MDNLLRLYTLLAICLSLFFFLLFCRKWRRSFDILSQMLGIMLNVSERLSVILTATETRHFMDEETEP